MSVQPPIDSPITTIARFDERLKNIEKEVIEINGKVDKIGDKLDKKVDCVDFDRREKETKSRIKDVKNIALNKRSKDFCNDRHASWKFWITLLIPTAIAIAALVISWIRSTGV